MSANKFSLVQQLLFLERANLTTHGAPEGVWNILVFSAGSMQKKAR